MDSRYEVPVIIRSTKATGLLIPIGNVPILLAADMVPWYHKAKSNLLVVLASVDRFENF
jgi:hypothetical protein